MRRILVAGGHGFFGSEIVRLLREDGFDPVPLSRRDGFDVENPAAIEARVKRGDLVIDAAGPFHKRSTALIESAIDRRFDVIDLSDSADYARAVMNLEGRIAGAGIRVLTSCSSVSTISAAVIAESGLERPTRVSVFLAPAARDTANRATLEALVDSLRRSVPETREVTFPDPVGRRKTFLLHSADEVWLPRTWPSLERIEFSVAPNVVGGNALLGIARHFAPLSLAPLARILGSSVGCFGVEVGDEMRTHSRWFIARDRSHLLAVIPAVLAAQRELGEVGLIPPTHHVDRELLWAALAKRAPWSAEACFRFERD